MKRNILVLTLASLLFIACSKENYISPDYGIFTILKNEISVEMNGEINSKSLKHFNKLYSAYPNIKNINIRTCEGSMDDETNLLLSAKINEHKINTHLLDNGIIASGGVDFFLAGIARSMGSNTKIGVHSWAGSDKNGQDVTAKDFPVGHKYHLPYINYYKTIGFSQEEAEAFYYFTINAAPAESVHWMTSEEITQYKLLTH